MLKSFTQFVNESQDLYKITIDLDWGIRGDRNYLTFYLQDKPNISTIKGILKQEKYDEYKNIDSESLKNGKVEVEKIKLNTIYS